MQKKVVLALLMAALLAGGVFADDEFSMSAGGGLLFDYSGGNGIEVSNQYFSYSMGINNTSFGIYGFFDATYIEADISLTRGSLSSYSDVPGVKEGDAGSMTQFGLSVLGKYPTFHPGGFNLFPLYGLSYNAVLSGKNEKGDSFKEAGDYSQFGILGGIGSDFDLSGPLYIRAEFLIQFRFSSKWQEDWASSNSRYFNTETTTGIGPRLKVGVGYKF